MTSTPAFAGPLFATIAALHLLCLPVTLLRSQVVLQPAAGPDCVGCRIDLRKVVTLGDKTGRGALHGDPYSVAQDSRGRIIVAVPDGPPEERLYVFDRNGKLLKRVGPRGEGPGELLSVRVIAIAPGDTLHVYDDVLGRHSVFDQDYRYIRSTVSPRGLSSAVFFPDGTSIIAASVNDPGRIGLLYHRFHKNGNYLNSFGDSNQVLSPSRPSLEVRRMGFSHGGGFWSGSWLYKYRLEMWSLSGKLLRVLEPQSTWFPPNTQILGPTPTRPPQPMLYGVWEDPYGLVWTSGVTAGKRYKQALGPKKMIEGAEVYPVQDPELVWDGIIEVFDPAKGVLLASLAVDAPFHFVLGPGRLAGVRWDEDGILSLEVVDVVLRRPRQ